MAKAYGILSPFPGKNLPDLDFLERVSLANSIYVSLTTLLHPGIQKRRLQHVLSCVYREVLVVGVVPPDALFPST